MWTKSARLNEKCQTITQLGPKVAERGRTRGARRVRKRQQMVTSSPDRRRRPALSGKSLDLTRDGKSAIRFETNRQVVRFETVTLAGHLFSIGYKRVGDCLIVLYLAANRRAILARGVQWLPNADRHHEEDMSEASIVFEFAGISGSGRSRSWQKDRQQERPGIERRQRINSGASKGEVMARDALIRENR
jgi:hypothetical protein